jgi:uncharacterized surface protein with fasciclin (FAS1) repeats
MSIFNKSKLLLMLLAGSITLIAACNKELPKATPIDRPADGTTPTLADLLNDPGFSILKAAVTKAGLSAVLADPAKRFTVFAPDDAAFTASGISAAVIGVLPAEQVAGLVSYHVVPQIVKAADISTSFPNFEYPSILNPAPAVSAFLRLSTFPSRRGSVAWVNNIPIIAADIIAVNGVVHKVARVISPKMPDGNNDLWDRINTDSKLTYLKAAIQRADSGVAVGARLLDALSITANPSAIASNLTVFAPTDDAMKAFLTGALTQAFVSQGFPLAQAQGAAVALVGAFGPLLISNPASIPNVPGLPPGIGVSISQVLTPTLAKGIVAYHVISRQTAPFTPPGLRVFSVNLPTTGTAVKTLLNGGVAIHPGVVVQATFGPLGVTAATVKGLTNATASNVLINPAPGGTSDQIYLNGVLHEIDQVLLPQ